MRVSYDWLKEYVDLKLQPDRLAEILTMAGLSVESVERVGSDHVLEIEITANRPDWLSMIGVAREVAALTGGRLKIPSLVTRGASLVKENMKQATSDEPRATTSVTVDEKKLCPRYTVRVIRNVRVGESPSWLKRRIEALGLRSVNNIVDITNFCLFETGEPMHAFDLDTITGAAVAVRKAKTGEKVVVIEGAEKALDNTMLIIADSQRPIAIAGVMGALNTEVTLSTVNILLEAAFFDPISVRRTSRKLGISTESSYRFERRVNPEAIAYASDRALGLILELAGGEAGVFLDIGEKEVPRRTVEVRPQEVNAILGTDIAPAHIRKIAESLGLEVRSESAEKLTLEIPGFRNDLRYEIDIIEEVSRIYGYNNIPATIPDVVEQPIRVDREMAVKQKIGSVLTGLGCDEIITYSLLSKKMIADAGISVDGLAEVQNPLSCEQEAMRPSLIPGMLAAAVWNINRKTRDLKLFELGNVYRAKADGYAETMYLSIGMAGQVFSGWAGAGRAAGFFELKGIAETLLAELGVKGVSFTYARHGSLLQSECADILIGGHAAGVIGQVNARTLASFDIKEKVYILELGIDAVLKDAVFEKRFREMPKYPAVFRDISVIAAKGTLSADIIASIGKAAGAVLKDAKLIDRYEGKQVPEGKVSLTYRLEYQDPRKTLEEKDVLDAHSRVLRSLEQELGAKLR